MKAVDILKTAAKLVGNDRGKAHGDMKATHEDVAMLWTAYSGVCFSGHDVAMMMVLLKMARARNGAVNVDDYIDMAGYAAIAGELRE